MLPASPAAISARPLRVAQVITKFTAGAGGITLRGALGLDPDRYQTTILAAEGGSLAARAVEAGLEVIPLAHMAADLSPRADVQGVGELTAKLAAGQFDIVHTHSAKAGAIGRIAARKAGVPAVVHSIHGFPFHEFQSRARRRAYLEIERRLGKITDYFLTDGTFVASEAVRLGIAPADRVRAIASPVDDDIPVVSESARREARLRLGLPPGARVVGTAARLDPQKSPLDMVRAIAGLQQPDVYMVWIGDGELRRSTEQLIAQTGLRERFLLAGERRDVAALLPAFDVFALSSLYEGLPCALVEAMVCGIPVVATAVNSVPEIVIPGKTGILARPGHPQSLTRALGYVLDYPSEGARMAEEARAHVADRFRPEVLGRDLTEVYEEVVRVTAAGRNGSWRTR